MHRSVATDVSLPFHDNTWITLFHSSYLVYRLTPLFFYVPCFQPFRWHSSAMASYDQLSSARNSPYDKPLSPYGSGDPYYNESSGYIIPQPAKKPTSKWIKIGIPILILAVIGGVVGVILVIRNHKASASGGSSAASSAASVKQEVGIFATATNSLYMVPIYPSTVSHSMIWHIRWQHFLLLVVRPTRPLSQYPRSIQAPALLEDGLQTHSNPLIQAQPTYDRIVPVSLPLLISGPSYPNSSPPTLTSSTGMTPFLKMQPNTTISPLLFTSLMATVVY